MKLRTRDLIHHGEKDVVDNNTAVVHGRVRKSLEKGTYGHEIAVKGDQNLFVQRFIAKSANCGIKFLLAKA